MSTIVNVQAHCSKDKEVIIRDVTSRDSDRDIILKDGEVKILTIFGDDQVLIFERLIPEKRV